MQKSSRWGSFLAGVESRLDTILADEDPTPSQSKGETSQSVQVEKKDVVTLPTPKPSGERTSRSSSTNRAQDRLNERLAKAMVARNLNRMNDKSPATSTLPSRTASPVNGENFPRSSSEINREQEAPELEKSPTYSASIKAAQPIREVAEQPNEEIDNTQDISSVEVEVSKPNRPPIDSHRSNSMRQSSEISGLAYDRPVFPHMNGSSDKIDTRPSESPGDTIELLRSDYEAAELQRQEEMHSYLERIDALQAKLQYLAKEAIEVAKKAKIDAEPDSIDEKLASKDERIALLMEEGHRMSQTELKHMSIIKKLRAKAMEDEKRAAEVKRSSERQEKAAREAQERAKRAEESEKRSSEKLKATARLEKDLETMRADRDMQDSLIQDLQFQLADATSVARQAEEKAQAEALEQERKRAVNLADDLSNLRLKQEVTERQYQAEIRGLREKSEREKERARVAEIERQSEQNILESRLEAFRARAEEASAGSSGDVQAKLLRQIETLQNQYVTASENWQGIETSLLARAAALEKERDDIAKKEADVRRKARETHIKCRRAEEELEQTSTSKDSLEHELSQQKSQLKFLQESISKAEKRAVEAEHELLTEREAWEAQQARQLELEKTRQKEESSRTPESLYQQFRTESPVTSGRNRKSSNPGRASPHNSRHLQGLAIMGSSIAPGERPLSRRSSTQPVHNYADPRPPSRQDSITFNIQPSVNGAVPETPSIQIDNQDDFFDGIHTPATPERTINDMISVSTAAAGPSVQLVERMSAAVRRLESEKASHKDELARILTQRDEAREQVVGLMKEAGDKAAADEKVKKLEKDVEELNGRYLTTLEMLGEKSERVEELKADVADLKQMYRELVDSTMR